MGTRRSKAIITAAIVIATIAGVMLAIRPDSGGQEAKTDPGVVLERVELLGSEKGVHRWKLLAGVFRQEKELVYLDQIDQLVLLENGEPKYYVYAQSGVWSPRENQLRLEGGVVVEDRAGFSLATDGLVWNSQKGLLDFVGSITVTVIQGGEADEED